MILTAALRSGSNAARGVVGTLVSAGTHALWWLDYHVGGGDRR